MAINEPENKTEYNPVFNRMLEELGKFKELSQDEKMLKLWHMLYELTGSNAKQRSQLRQILEKIDK